MRSSLDSAPKRNCRRVYNLKVDGDNTYIAGNVVVHNCNQTIFMKKKQTPAHVGYWEVDCRTSKGRGITQIIPKFTPFYE